MRIGYLEEGGVNLRFLAAILQNAALARGNIALEIGCGTGILAEVLEAITGATIVGTERSYEAFQIASRRISAQYRPDGSIPCSEVFDSIYCKDVLPMVENKGLFFLQVRQALRAGSPFITYLPQEMDYAEKAAISILSGKH